MAATEEEMEAIVENVMAKAADDIDDSARFSQGESRDMWRSIAQQAENNYRLIESEMHDDD